MIYNNQKEFEWEHLPFEEINEDSIEYYLWIRHFKECSSSEHIVSLQLSNITDCMETIQLFTKEEVQDLIDRLERAKSILPCKT